jgi:sugar porter (SP) family MFS transporter
MSSTAEDVLEKNIATTEVDEVNDELHVTTIQGSDELARARLANPPKPLSRSLWLLYLACLPAYLCGTMSGYDGSVMGSFLVEGSFDTLFGAGVNGFEAGYITAMYQIGSCASIVFIGESMDRFGRRFGIFIGCLLAVLGAVIQGTSARTGSLPMFLGGRFLLGFGANIAQSAAPTYVVEISHPAYRGALTGGQSSSQNFGGLIAAAVTLGTVNIVGSGSWLIPTYSQLVCPGIACLTVFLFPESPRWLYTHGKQEAAKKFLTKYHGEGDEENPYVKLEIAEFEEQLDMNGADKKWWDYRVLFRTRSQRYRMANSLSIGIWGALSNGGISYFVGAFFNSAGITNAQTVLQFNVWQNFMSTGASYMGSVLADRIGRRTLLLPTLFGMGVSWIAIAVGTALVEAAQAKNQSNKAAANAGIAFYFIFSFIYCVGITPLQGVYAVEVFSYEQRAKGMGFANFVINAVSLINQFATPVALQVITYKFYIILGVWNFFEFGVSYLWNVETKGFTLEELDAIFEAPNPRKASTQRKKVVVDGDVNLSKMEQV